MFYLLRAAWLTCAHYLTCDFRRRLFEQLVLDQCLYRHFVHSLNMSAICSSLTVHAVKAMDFYSGMNQIMHDPIVVGNVNNVSH